MSDNPEAGQVPASFAIEGQVRSITEEAIDAGLAEFLRAEGKSGRVHVVVELHLVRGRPRWHSASVYFAEHEQYEG